MQISSSNNFGMATLLQNNKAFVKTLNVNGVIGGNNIIVGSASANLATPILSGNNGTVTTINNIMMPTQPSQTFMLTNSATGNSSIISYQQYQQLLQQQHHQQQQQQHHQQQQQQQQQMVSLPVGSIVQTSNGGLAVISSSNVAATPGVATTQGAFLIAASAASTNNMLTRNTYVTATSNNTNGYQQQFLQVATSTPTPTSSATATTTRYFSQFSQQPQLTQQQTLPQHNNSNNNNINNNNNNRTLLQKLQQQQLQQLQQQNVAIHQNNINSNNNGQTRTVFISRNANVSATTVGAGAGNAATRLPQPLIVKKVNKSVVQRTATASVAATTNENMLAGKTLLVTTQPNNLNRNVNNIILNKATATTLPALQKLQTPQSLSIKQINPNQKLIVGNNMTKATGATIASLNAIKGTLGTSTTTPATVMNGNCGVLASGAVGNISNGTLPNNNNNNNNSFKNTSFNYCNNNNKTIIENNKFTNASASFNANTVTKTIIPSASSSTTTVLPANLNNTTTTTTTTTTSKLANEETEVEPEIDIVINNVVCSFSVRCHLHLREIALKGFNVEYRRENGMVTMKLRRPYTTASIWSSGRITCTGATSEDQAKIAARRYARCLNKLGFPVRFHNFRVVNVLGTCSMPWAIKIVNFSERYKKDASYEPELHPGVTYKLRYPKATLKIFSTGSVTVTAASVANVQAAIEHIFPLVYEFRKPRSPEELEQLRLKQLQHANAAIIHVEEEEDDVEDEDNILLKSSTVVKKGLKRRPALRKIEGPSKGKKVRVENKVLPDEICEDLDDPNASLPVNLIEEVANVDADGLIMYDPNDLIEGPEEEDY